MARRLGQSVLLIVAGIALSIGAQAQAPAAAAAPQAAQDLAPIAFVPFGGTDPMAADKVKGQIEVEGGKAILASSERLTAIGSQSRAQSDDSGVVVGAIGGLTGIAEQNAAAMEEMAATLRETLRTVEDLSRAAEKLNSLAARFQV